MMNESYLPDVTSDRKPDRILLVTQLSQGTTGSIYEYFLSDETRVAKDLVSRKLMKLSEYLKLRDRDLAATLASFPDYEVKPPSFAGDISLYRKQSSVR